MLLGSQHSACFALSHPSDLSLLTQVVAEGSSMLM